MTRREAQCFDIRKLTPRETGRLMGVREQRLDQMERSGLKPSALYKLFGNSIVVDVLAAIYRVVLANEAGVRMVAIYPKVTGSVSDKDVVANPDKYPGKTAAEESMLTPDLLTWNLGATIGTKFSKKFAIDKTAQKVAYNPAQTAAEPASDDPTQQGGSEQGGTTNPPSGGGENEDGE